MIGEPCEGETSSGDMTEIEISVARAYDDRSGWRVDDGGFGFVRSEWLERFRSRTIPVTDTRRLSPPRMTSEQLYLAGLRAGWIDESHGIVEPVPGYPESDPYLAGVRRGREAWRREVEVAMVVDAPPVRNHE